MGKYDLDLAALPVTESGQTAPLPPHTNQMLQESMGAAPSIKVDHFGIFFFFGVMLTAIIVYLLTTRALHRRRCLPPSGKVAVGCLHELGARNSQQDAYGVTGENATDGLLAVVADGMGGLVHSEQVSKEIVASMLDFYTHKNDFPPLRCLQLLLGQTVKRVEQQMQNTTAQSGSTLVACMVQDNRLSWVSVGDSRIYLWRNGGLIQLNRDHDFHHDLTLLAMKEEISFEEADNNPRRENLTSYIGGEFPKKIEWNPEPILLCRKDKILLVSDGVYRSLTQQELANCLSKSVDKSAKNIISAIHSKALPQQDNFTAVVLEIR